MKFRTDYVTNSSSSSFIIAAKDIRFEDLFYGAFKEFFCSVYKHLTKEEINKLFTFEYTVENDDICCSLYIRNGKEVNEENYCDCYPDDEIYYVINNNTHIRFSWDIVKQIFEDKYKISYEYGYCD